MAKDSVKTSYDLKKELLIRVTYYRACVASNLDYMDESYKCIKRAVTLYAEAIAEEKDVEIQDWWKSEYEIKLKTQFNSIHMKFIRMKREMGYKEKAETELLDLFKPTHSAIFCDGIPAFFKKVSRTAVFSTSLEDWTPGDYARADVQIAPGNIIAKEVPAYTTFGNFMNGEDDDWHLKRCAECFTQTYLLIPCPCCTHLMFCSNRCIASGHLLFQCYGNIDPFFSRDMAAREFRRMSPPGSVRQWSLVYKILLSESLETWIVDNKCSDEQQSLLQELKSLDTTGFSYRLCKLWAEHSMYIVIMLRDCGFFGHTLKFQLPICINQEKDCSSCHYGELPPVPERLSKNEFHIFKWAFKLFALLNKRLLDIEEVGSRGPFLEKNFHPRDHIATRTLGHGFNYTISSAFQHDCDPNCILIANGEQTMVMNTKILYSGDQLTISYGFDFIYQTLPQRQFLSTFKFGQACECRACTTDMNFYTLNRGTKVEPQFYESDESSGSEDEYVEEYVPLEGLVHDPDQLISSLPRDEYVNCLLKYAARIAFFTTYKDMEGNEQLYYIVRQLLEALQILLEVPHSFEVRLRAMLVHMAKIRYLAMDNTFGTDCWFNRNNEEDIFSTDSYFHKAVILFSKETLIPPPLPDLTVGNLPWSNYDFESFYQWEKYLLTQYHCASGHMGRVNFRFINPQSTTYAHPISNKFLYGTRKSIPIAMDHWGLSMKRYGQDLSWYKPERKSIDITDLSIP